MELGKTPSVTYGDSSLGEGALVVEFGNYTSSVNEVDTFSFSGGANPFVLRTFPLAGESPQGEGREEQAPPLRGDGGTWENSLSHLW